MLSKITGTAEKLATWFNLITGLSVMGVGGIVSNYMATKTTWIAQAGPYGVWLATLLGMLLVAVIFAACVKARGWYEDEKLNAKWRDRGSSVNPLDAEFHKRRIDLQSLAHPISKRISKKKFFDCEIIGPANIVFHGSGTLLNVGFVGCDMISVRDALIKNVIVIEECQISNCIIFGCTVYVHMSGLQPYKDMGAEFITLTGDPQLDGRPHGATVGSTQQ